MRPFRFSGLLILQLNLPCFNAFLSSPKIADSTPTLLFEKKEVSSFSDTDAASKGVVSTLTNIFNNAQQNSQKDPSRRTKMQPPKSSQELQDRIRDDYDVNNYLWTGKLDLDCFDDKCRFTDPTLSFEGTDKVRISTGVQVICFCKFQQSNLNVHVSHHKFLQNTDSLVPLVDRFVENYQSILLDIELTDDYVQTRWNMVGELNGLFWKPKIDVIGRTKFWFHRDSCLVYFYDESWEIPAYQALMQIVTPAGTFPNSSIG